MNIRKLYYLLSPRARRIVRRLVYLPVDLLDSLRGKPSLVPPKGKIFVGAGDFERQGMIFLEYFKTYTNLKPTDHVLDVGCGSGVLAIAAAKCWPARILDYFWHLTLPLICLVISSFAVTTMLTKNTFVEEMRKQYVLVARAKGLTHQRVLYKHIFRNALIPLVTGFPAAFVGAFFAGSVLIETLFSLDGLGLLSFESVVRRDYPVVLGSLYLFTLIALVVKLVSDLLYVAVDPRVQFEAVGK